MSTGPHSESHSSPTSPGTQTYSQSQPKLANWGWRALAYILDLLPLVILFALTIVASSTPGSSEDASSQAAATDSAQQASSGQTILVLVAWIVMIAYVVWNYWYLQGRTGSTWAKKLLKMRLVSDKDGKPIGFGRSFLRYVCHILDALPCYLGYLWPLWDGKRQTFADKIMKTVVTKD